MTEQKPYDMTEVEPLRGSAVNVIKKMEVGTALNFPMAQRKNYSVAIYRMHIKKEGRWRTVSIKGGMFAVMRLE